jgi:hypothetical protein
LKARRETAKVLEEGRDARKSPTRRKSFCCINKFGVHCNAKHRATAMNAFEQERIIL